MEKLPSENFSPEEIKQHQTALFEYYEKEFGWAIPNKGYSEDEQKNLIDKEQEFSVRIARETEELIENDFETELYTREKTKLKQIVLQTLQQYKDETIEMVLSGKFFSHGSFNPTVEAAARFLNECCDISPNESDKFLTSQQKATSSAMIKFHRQIDGD